MLRRYSPVASNYSLFGERRQPIINRQIRVGDNDVSEMAQMLRRAYPKSETQDETGAKLEKLLDKLR